MKTLKLKKVKISSITNPYLLYGGAQQGAANNHKTNPDTIVNCPTQDEDDYGCASQTNGSISGRTEAPRNRQ